MQKYYALKKDYERRIIQQNLQNAWLSRMKMPIFFLCPCIFYPSGFRMMLCSTSAVPEMVETHIFSVLHVFAFCFIWNIEAISIPNLIYTLNFYNIVWNDVKKALMKIFNFSIVLIIIFYCFMMVCVWEMGKNVAGICNILILFQKVDKNQYLEPSKKKSIPPYFLCVIKLYSLHFSFSFQFV